MIEEVMKMSSFEIAELTGRSHSDVMSIIHRKEPMWVLKAGRLFSLVGYEDTQGRKRSMYKLTLLECMFIATMFSKKQQADLLNRWIEMELEAEERERRANASKAYIKALERLIASEKARQRALEGVN